MVRKDPINERGPAPPGGRVLKPSIKPASRTLFQLRPVEEYENMWNTALSGLHGHLDTVVRYVQMDIPIDYSEGLDHLKARIDKLVKEAKQ